MPKSLEELFGRLRELMNQGQLDHNQRDLVWRLVDHVFERAPERYREQWVPYMAGFPHHFEEALREVRSLEDLERAHELVPHARWRLFYDASRGQGLEVLASSELLTHVGELLLGTGGDTAGLAALVHSPHLESPRWLSLQHSALGDEDAEVLAQAPALASLRQLSLRSNEVGDAGVVALAQSAHLSGLEHLSLGYNQLSSLGARALAESPHLTSLRDLELSYNEIGDEGAVKLVGSENARALERLYLSEADLGDEAARALAGSPYLERLHIIYLDKNHIGDPGAVALAQDSTLSHGLFALLLEGNLIGERGWFALSRSPHMPQHVRQQCRAMLP